MTTVEAAEYARCGVHTIRDAAACGDLDGVKITAGSVRSRWLFTTDDIDRWLERGRVVGGIAVRRPRRQRRQEVTGT
jgi:excisionase family DNA binding protein